MEEEDVSSSPNSPIRIRGISPQLLALLPTFTNFLINRVWNHILLVLFAPDIFHGILVFFMTHKKHIFVNCHQLQSQAGFNWKKYNYCGLKQMCMLCFSNMCVCYKSIEGVAV